MPKRSQLTHTARFDAFDTHITDKQIEAYRASGGHNPGSSWIVPIILLVFLSVAFFIGFMVTILTEAARGNVSPADWKEAASLAYASLALSLPLIPIFYWNKRGAYKAMARNVQLKQFVEDNNWRLDEYPGQLERPGILFNEGMERRGVYTVESHSGQPFTFGEYAYVTGYGRGRATNNWGFVEVPTSVKLPHIILDAKANNIFNSAQLTSLPKAFNRDKQISVSPKVDELYAVYAPEKDSKKIGQYFTPEFIDKVLAIGDNLDFEVVDGKVYAYRLWPFHPVKEDMQKVMAIVDLLQETFGEAAPAVDDAATPKTVAKHIQGERVLQGRTPKLVKILGLIGITVQIIVAIALVSLD